jgi:L-ascorbate metabolism protein UlaG (beta-lactamase superfamily)
MDARQGVQALRTVTPREVIPIHYDDYTLFKSPLSDFRKAAGNAGLPSVIHYLNRGDRYHLGTRQAGTRQAGTR